MMPSPNSDPQPPTPELSIRQQADSSTLGGGMQASKGERNIQIQGSGNQIINLMLFLDKATVEQTKKSQEPIANESELVVSSSGKWVLLQGHFFQADNVHRYSDGTLTVQIASDNAQDDATIQSLRPSTPWGQSQLITFAHRNDGYLVNVASIEGESSQDSYIWTLTLKPANIQYGGSSSECSYQGRERSYSANDIAELRGKRILLNKPPKLVTNSKSYYPLAEDLTLETLIRGGVDTPIKVENCVLQSLYPAYKDRPKLFLELARLVAIFSLKAGGVVEQALELSLGPIDQARVHIRFRGRRRKVYVNVEPAVIEIEGDCPLE